MNESSAPQCEPVLCDLPKAGAETMEPDAMKRIVRRCMEEGFNKANYDLIQLQQ